MVTDTGARAGGPDVAETGNYPDIDRLLSRGRGGGWLQGRAGVLCGAAAGSLTLEGSDVGDKGSVLAGGWAGLGWAAGKIWPERISRKEVTSDSRGLAHCYSCFCRKRGNLCNDIL